MRLAVTFEEYVLKNVVILFLACFFTTAQAGVINGFSGEFSPSQWQTIGGTNLDSSISVTDIGGNLLYDNVSQFSADNQTLIQISKDDQSGQKAVLDTIYFNGASQAGIVSFDWFYHTTDDAGWDFFGWLLNGDYIQLNSSVLTTDSGSASFAVEQGDIFGFRSISIDSLFGAGFSEVSNFEFAPREVPEPSTLAIFALACIGLGFAKRARNR